MRLSRLLNPAAMCMALTTSSALAAEKPSVPEEVRTNLTERVTAGETAGVVVGLMTPEGSTYFARHRKAEGDPQDFNAETIFEIGSVTKVFTAMLLADAVRRGEVALDDPVDKFLPDDVGQALRKHRPITLKDLAMHRSGLPRLPDNLHPADSDDPYADYSPERLYDFLRRWSGPTAAEPAFAYSNLGCGLLGHVLTLVAKKSYEELMIERITKPLGMSDTRLVLSEVQKKRLAAGHDGDNQVKNWHFDALAGAGAIRSSAADMLKFLRAFLGTAPPDVLAVTKAMLASEASLGEGKNAVALGWIIDRSHGSDIIWHNGGTGGYHSFCGFRPDTKTAAVVLNNSTSAMDDVGFHLLNPQYAMKPAAKQIKVAPEKLDKLVGYYELQPGMVFHITREGDGLFAKLTGQSKLPVYPESERKFVYKAVDAALTFDLSDAGEPVALTLHQGGRDQRARKLGPDYAPPPPPKEVTVDPKILQTYVGKYSLGGGRAIMDVRLDGGQLSVQLTGQPRFPIYAESETKFFLKVVEAQITFGKDESGKVAHLILHQGGIDQKAPKTE